MLLHLARTWNPLKSAQLPVQLLTILIILYVCISCLSMFALRGQKTLEGQPAQGLSNSHVSWVEARVMLEPRTTYHSLGQIWVV